MTTNRFTYLFKTPFSIGDAVSDNNGVKAEGRRKLSMRDAYRLTSWVDAQRDRLAKSGMTRPQIAEEAAKALGFAVTPANAAAAFKALDIRPPTRRPSGGEYVRKVRERLEALEVRVEQLEGRLAEADRILSQLR